MLIMTKIECNPKNFQIKRKTLTSTVTRMHANVWDIYHQTSCIFALCVRHNYVTSIWNVFIVIIKRF